MRSEVFNAVAAQGADCPGGYNTAMHERVDELVLEWIDTTGGYAYGGTDSLQKSIDRCDKWCRAEYCARYSREPEHMACGFIPLLPFLLLAIIGGAISWYVQRTLNRWYPLN